MRYDKQIYFVLSGTREYDAETGDYSDTAPVKTAAFASVASTDDSTMTVLYGGIKQGSLTIHLQNAYAEPFNLIEIDGKQYHADRIKRLRTKQSIVISEVL